MKNRTARELARDLIEEVKLACTGCPLELEGDGGAVYDELVESALDSEYDECTGEMIWDEEFYEELIAIPRDEFVKEYSRVRKKVLETE